LFNGFQPYEQRAGKLSPGAFSCGPKACPDDGKDADERCHETASRFKDTP